MRCPVHKKINYTAEKSKKIFGRATKFWIVLSMLLILDIFMIVGEIWLGLLILLLGICLGTEVVS